MFQISFCGDDNNVLWNQAIFAGVAVAVYYAGSSPGGVDSPQLKKRLKRGMAIGARGGY